MKNNIKQKVALAFFLVAFVQFPLAQWSNGEGNGYYKLGSWFLQADEHFTSNGERDPNATRGQFNVNFYVEYGITNKIDVIAYVPFLSRTYQNDVISGATGNLIAEGDDVNSIGDIDLSVRYGIIKNDRIAVSASLLLGLPTGNDSGGEDGSYQTGDGEFNQMIKSSVGTTFSLGKLPGYAKGYLGYNNRTQDFSDELRTGAEIGLNVFKWLWLATKLDVTKSLKNGSLSAVNNQGSIFANNVEFTGLGVEANIYFTRDVGLSLNYTSALAGRIIYAAPSYSGGIFLDLK